MAKATKLTKPISILFLLYFVILFIERAQSLLRVAAEGRSFTSEYAILVNVTAMLSLLMTIIMLIAVNRPFLRSLFTDAVPDYSVLTITSGVMLVSGMVHTEYTIPPIQFASYGALILAMILRTAELSKTVGNRFSLWYSLIYLTMFSMAIPVIYQLYQATDLSYERVFYLVEANVMLLLVVCFTLMLRRLFIGRGEDLLLWIPFLIMTVGDAAVLWMRWDDEINFFVLIFAVISAVLFIAGRVILSVLKKRQGRSVPPLTE